MKKVFSLIVSFVLCILCYPANILPVVADEGFATRKSEAIQTLLDNYGLSSDDIIDWHYIEEHPFTVISDPSQDTDAGYCENYGTLDYYVETDMLVCCVCAITDTDEYTYRHIIGSPKDIPFSDYWCRTYVPTLEVQMSSPFHGVVVETYNFGYVNGEISIWSGGPDELTQDYIWCKSLTNKLLIREYELTKPVSAVSGEDMWKLFNLGIDRYNDLGSSGKYGTDANSQFTLALLSPDKLFYYYNTDVVFQTYNVPFELESVNKNRHIFDFSFQLTNGIWYGTTPSYDAIIYIKKLYKPITYVKDDMIVTENQPYYVYVRQNGSFSIDSNFPDKRYLIGDIPFISGEYCQWWLSESSIKYNLYGVGSECYYDGDSFYLKYISLGYNSYISNGTKVYGSYEYNPTKPTGKFVKDSNNNNKFVYFTTDNKTLEVPEVKFTVDNYTFIVKIRDIADGRSEVTVTEGVEDISYNVSEYNASSELASEVARLKAELATVEEKNKNLTQTIEYKDKIINTKEETIIALSSQVEYWKKHCGDTDNDGRISISDSIILNRYLAGTVESLPCSDPPPLAPEDDLM